VKRPLLAVTAVVAAVTLSSCDSVSSTQNAATVGDGEVTVDELQSVMQALGNTNPATGTMDGETARGYLTEMVRGVANEQYLAAHGEQISDADRQQALASASVPEGLPDDVVRVIADSLAGTGVRARIDAPSADELQRRYEARPADLGVVCIRQVVLANESEAQDVVAELQGGASIEDIARARSIDDATKSNGGAVQDSNGTACVPAYDTEHVDDAVVGALVEAAPGEVVGPVRGAAGWYVVQPRPYGDIADDLAALVAQHAGDLLFFAYLNRADVIVDPRYGRWDLATASVVPLQPTRQ
jgi:PPIC-type PPIASE domain